MQHGESPPSQQSLARSFRVAWDGLTDAMRSQRNMRIHLLCSVAAIMAGGVCGLSRIEWAILTLTIGLVWACELVNTAIEAAVDLTCPTTHELARLAKDVASAAVLLAAVTSIVIGLLLFGTHLWELVTVST